MKNIMRVVSVLLLFALIMIVIATAFDVDEDFMLFAAKISDIFSKNLLPIVSIAICAYCLERNDTNLLIRIIPIYMLIPIILTILQYLFDSNADWLVDTYDVLQSTFSGVTALSLMMVIKANNRITTILKYIGYGLIATIVIITIAAEIQKFMSETLPNVYDNPLYSGYGSYNVVSLGEVALKIYMISYIAEIFVIILLYITNFAFSDKVVYDYDEIDYNAVKEDAMKAANMQMNEIYNDKIKTQEIDRSESEKGLMNVNNQLSQNSNVGTVKEQAKEVNVQGSSLDSLMPLSSGPVINQTIDNNVQEEKKEEQPAPQPAPVEQTLPPNQDIQEQMKMKVQNENQSQQNIQQ